MSASAAVSSASFSSDIPPRTPFTGGMASGGTTYATLVEVQHGNNEFLPARPTRASQHPMLKDRAIERDTEKLYEVSRNHQQNQQRHGDGRDRCQMAAGGRGHGNGIGKDDASVLEGNYLALDFRTRSGEDTEHSIRGSEAAMSFHGGPKKQEVLGLEASSTYQNLCSVRNPKQAFLWYKGSAPAAEIAMHEARAEGMRKGKNASNVFQVGQDGKEWPVAGVLQSVAGSHHHHPREQALPNASEEIYVNTPRRPNGQRATSSSPTHGELAHSRPDEPVYINASQSSSNDSVFQAHTSALSSSTSSPGTSPLPSPRSNGSVAATPVGRSRNDCNALSPNSHYVEYENTRATGMVATRAASSHISHQRYPSEPCHSHASGALLGSSEFGGHLMPTQMSSMYPYSTEHAYTNGLSTPMHHSGRSKSSVSLTAGCEHASDAHISSRHKHSDRNMLSSNRHSTSSVSTTSPSPPSASPLSSPCLEESAELVQGQCEWKKSEADTLFGSFQLLYIGAEPVDRGYGVIAQAIRNTVKKNTAMATKVWMNVSATAVTVLSGEGTQKYRHEVDSIECMSPWRQSSTPLPADLATYVAYVVVQEGQSAVCYVFQAVDSGARRTVCKTIESALYADVKNFKSMTYPKFDVEAKAKSATQFSLKYIGSTLVQTTFHVIDDAARRLLSNTNPSRINFAFMDISEDRIRLTNMSSNSIFGAHLTPSIAALNVFSEDGRVFGYVLKQKGAGTKCHIFRCSRPSTAFAIVDIIKDVIQDNYKASEAEESSAKSENQKTGKFLDKFRRNNKKPKMSASTSNISLQFNGQPIQSAEPRSAAAAVDKRVRSVSDVNPPSSTGLEAAYKQHRVDYLGNMSIEQDTINDIETRQIVERLNQARKRSYIVTLSVSKGGIHISGEHGKSRDISVRSIVSVRLHPDNADYALILTHPQPNSNIRYCHVVHQLSHNAQDILRDVTKLLV